jgi:hypothetical protein
VTIARGRIVTLLLLLAILLYAGVAVFLYVMQRPMMYPAFGGRTAPSKAGLSGVEEVVLPTPDGETLVAWWKPPAPGARTILFLHGNAGNLAMRADRIRLLTADGTGLLLLAYRGYSGSTGSPTEEGLATDARTAFDWLARRVDPAGIVLLGESLGSGVAVRLAQERPVAGVILDAPYTSTADVARRLYWWLPVGLLMKDQYPSIDRIAGVRAPILVLHGDGDGVIPFALGERLYAAANEPKSFLRIAGGNHTGNIERPEGLAEVRRFIDGLKAGKPLPAGTPASP